MNQIDIIYYKTVIGELMLGSYKNQLCLLDFRNRKMRKSVDTRIKKGLNAEFVECSNNFLAEVKVQLDEYLNGERREFDIPLLLVGTKFQKAVWEALLKIPYGTTLTYLQIAKSINNEKAVRAVANANGVNSIGVIIPCHRVIGSDGSLVGYSGGVDAKKKLLEIEAVSG